ncbi:MAG TPA: metal-sensitive transcriptional regulator [Acidimicrobiales bacterium]|nr:metal-sensitive transcriptional regulator [Acidimicrobiales bacterium]
MEIDATALNDVAKRLRRVQGQIGGVIQMIEDGRQCADVLTQIAAASRALDRAGFKLVASGLRQCLSAQADGRGDVPSEHELERLFMSLA